MTTTEPRAESMSVNELLSELGGRLSYRQLDYWVRTGTVLLRYPGRGSGSRRRIFPDERLAIFALVEAYEKAQADMAYLRSGELFLELLGWNDLATLNDFPEPLTTIKNVS